MKNKLITNFTVGIMLVNSLMMSTNIVFAEELDNDVIVENLDGEEIEEITSVGNEFEIVLGLKKGEELQLITTENTQISTEDENVAIEPLENETTLRWEKSFLGIKSKEKKSKFRIYTESKEITIISKNNEDRKILLINQDTSLDDTDKEEDIKPKIETKKLTEKEQLKSVDILSNKTIDLSATIPNNEIKDGTPTFDSIQEPGNDVSENNGIVRSFDSITYPLKITANSHSGENLKNVKLKITAEIKNGMINGRTNAGFSTNTKEDYQNNTVTMEEIYNLVETGNAINYPIVVNVGGAINDIPLGLKVKIQVIEADGKNLESENIIEEITNIKEIKTSSKVNIGVRAFFGVTGGSPNKYPAYGMIENYTPDDRNIIPLNIDFMAIPLTGKSNVKGSSLPSGKIKFKTEFSGYVNWLDDNGTTSSREDLVFSKDNSPQLLSYHHNDATDSEINKHYDNSLAKDMNYKWRFPSRQNTSPARSKLVIPDNLTHTNNLRSVYDSGKVLVKERNESKGIFSFELSDYTISSHFPIYRADGWTGGRAYSDNQKGFSTYQMMYLTTNSHYVGGKSNPNNKSNNLFTTAKVTMTSYEENGKEVVVNKSTSITTSDRNNTTGGYGENLSIRDSKGSPMGSFSVGDGSVPYGDGQTIANQPLTIQGYNNSQITLKGGTRNIIRWNTDSFEMTESDIEFNEKKLSTIKYIGARGQTSEGMEKSWGVSKIPNHNSKENLMYSSYKDYDWYPTYKEAENKGIVSAMQYETRNEVLPGVSHSKGFRITGKTEKLGSINEKGTPNIVTGDVWLYPLADRKTEIHLNQNKTDFTRYDENNLLTKEQVPLGSPTNFDTLGIVGLKASNNISTDKKTYYSTEEIEVKTTGSLLAPSTISTVEPVNVLSILPKGLNYVDGTMTYGGNPIIPSVTRNDKGETELNHKIDFNGKENIKEIKYKVEADNLYIDYINNVANLNIKTIISTPKDTSKVKLRTKDTTVSIVSVGQLGISQDIDKLYSEINTPFEVDIIPYTTTDREKGVRGIFTIPRNGVNDSKFNGTIKLDTIKNESKKNISYYINKSFIEETNPNNINTNGNGWELYTNQDLSAYNSVFYQINEDLTSEDGRIITKVKFKTSNNLPENIYKSVIYGNSDSNYKVETMSNIVQHRVISREINGISWIDTNENGLMDSSENRLSSVGVSLYKKNTSNQYIKVNSNISGKDISKIKTDSSGKYSFNHLPSGEYAVGFNMSDLKDYNITKKEVSNDVSITSKVEKDLSQDNHILTKIVKLPESNDMETPVFEQEHMNIGVFKTPLPEISKQVYKNGIESNNAKVNVGDLITFKLNFRNTEVDSTILNANIIDTLDQHLSVKDIIVKLNGKTFTNYSTNGNKLVFNIGDISNTSQNTLEITTKVLNTADKEINNSFILEGENIENVKSNIVGVTVDSLPKITKSVDKSEVVIGDKITYHIRVKNELGGGLWKNVILTDELTDVNQEIDKSTIKLSKNGTTKTLTPSEYTILDKKLEIPLGDIKSNEEIIISFVSKIVDYAPTYLNKATASGSGKSVSSSVTTKSKYVPSDITLSKKVFSNEENIDTKKVFTGDVLTYELTVQNTKDNSLIRDVLVSDILPENLEFIKDTVTLNNKPINDYVNYNQTKRELKIAVGNTENLTKYTLRFNVKVTNKMYTTFTNIANLTGTDVSTNSAKFVKSNEVSNYVEPLPSIEKTSNKTKTVINDTIDYTIKLSNGNGAGAWKGVTIKDNLSDKNQSIVISSLQLIKNGESTPLTSSDYSFDGISLEVPVGDILSNEEISLTYKTKITKYSPTYHNTAEAIGSNKSTDKVKVELESIYKPSDYKVTKRVFNADNVQIDNTQVNTNDILTYEFELKGLVDKGIIEDIRINEVLDESLKYIDGSIELNGESIEGIVQDNSIIIPLERLENLDSTKVRLKVKVLRTSKEKFHNYVTVEAMDKATNLPLNRSSNDIFNTTIARPYIDKTSDKEEVNNGDTVTFTIRIGNEKNSSKWKEIYLSDMLDTQLFELIPNSTKIKQNEKLISLKDSDVWTDGSLNYEISEILENEEYELTYKVKVKDFSTNYYNTVTTESENHEYMESTVELTNKYVPTNISMTKEVLQDNIDVENKKIDTNSKLRYKLIINNQEKNSEISNVLVTDKLDKNIKLLTDTITVNNEKLSIENISLDDNNLMELKLENIKGNSPIIVEYDVIVLNTMKDTFKNKASIKGIDVSNLNELETTTNTVSNYVEPSPYIQKESDKSTAVINDTIKYTISVGNKENNGVWESVTLTDYLRDTNQEIIEDSIQLTKNGVTVDSIKYELNDNKLKLDLGDILEGTEYKLVYNTKIINYAENYFNSVKADGSNDSTEEVHTNIKSLLEPSNFNITKKVLQNGVSIDESEVDTNSTLTYELEVINENSNGEIVDINITDNLPNSVKYVPNTTTVNGKLIKDSIEDNKLSINYDSLSKENSLLIQFDVIVKRESSSIFENIAQATGTDRATNNKYERVSNKVTNVVYPQPKLNKTANKTKVDVLDEVEFTIKASNNKDKGKWDNVTIYDTLDTSKFQLVENSTEVFLNEELLTNKSTDVWNENELTYNIDTILENDILEIKYLVKVINYDSKYINTAMAVGDNGTPKLSTVVLDNNKTPANIQITQKVLKDNFNIDNEIVNTNEEITYSLKVNNTEKNSLLKEVTILDELPDNVTFVEDSLRLVDSDKSIKHTYDKENRELELVLSELNSNDMEEIQFEVIVEPKTTYKFSNIADVRALDQATKRKVTDVSNKVTNDVRPLPKVTKKVNEEITYLNEILQWEVKVSNESDKGVLISPNLKDELPKEMEYVPNTTYIDGILQNDGIVWKENKLDIPFDNMLESEVKTITYDTKVVGITETNELSNTAYFYGENNEGNSLVVESTDKAITYYRKGDLTSVKTVTDSKGNDISNTEVVVGEELNYSIKLLNNSENSKVSNVKIIDTLPKGITEEEVTEILVDGNPYENIKYTVNNETDLVEIEINLGDIIGKFETDITYTIKANNGDDNQLIINTQTTTATMYLDNEEIPFKTTNYTQNIVKPLVKLHKEVTKNSVSKNEDFKYILNIDTLNGSNIINPTILDKLPNNLIINKDLIKVEGINKEDYIISWKDNEFKLESKNLLPNTKIKIEIPVTTEDSNLGEEFINTFTLTSNEGRFLINEESNQVKTTKYPVKVIIDNVKNKLPKPINQAIVKTGNILQKNYMFILVGIFLLVSSLSLIYYKKNR